MNKKIGIWGLGIVGKSAIRYFYQQNYSLEIIDRRAPTLEEQSFLSEHKAIFYLQDELPAFLDRNDLILPSPGIDLRPYSSYAHKWISELDLFAQECKKPIIAITGSVGKTTVTHLLSCLLAAQNKKIFTGGNIGKGLLDSIEEANDADLIVLEVSSFQLELCKFFTPSFAICTNIYANHLDRHGSMQAYVDAKLNILAHQTKQNFALFPLECYQQISETVRASRPFHFFTANSPSKQDFLAMNGLHALYFLHNYSLFRYYQTKITQIIDFKELPETSYPQNIIVLASAVHMLGFSLSNFVSILNEQELPEHRLEKVATINDIDFYNDSKATIPASTLAAIDKIKGRPIVLFLGGISKGVDRCELVKNLCGKVRFVYCFGKEAELLKQYCDFYNIPARAYPTLEETFITLPSVIKPSDQILFSPAGASFDLFSDYKERGDSFKKLVNSLKSQTPS